MTQAKHAMFLPFRNEIYALSETAAEMFNDLGLPVSEKNDCSVEYRRAASGICLTAKSYDTEAVITVSDDASEIEITHINLSKFGGLSQIFIDAANNVTQRNVGRDELSDPAAASEEPETFKNPSDKSGVALRTGVLNVVGRFHGYIASRL